MTELEISIGGRSFSVACDNEEQEKVRQAAALINEEAELMNFSKNYSSIDIVLEALKEVSKER